MTLADSLRGIDLAGRDTIATLAEDLHTHGRPPLLALGTIPDGGGPAVFAWWPDG